MPISATRPNRCSAANDPMLALAARLSICRRVGLEPRLDGCTLGALVIFCWPPSQMGSMLRRLVIFTGHSCGQYYTDVPLHIRASSRPAWSFANSIMTGRRIGSLSSKVRMPEKVLPWWTTSRATASAWTHCRRSLWRLAPAYRRISYGRIVGRSTHQDYVVLGPDAVVGPCSDGPSCMLGHCMSRETIVPELYG
jgi:hypothetical protein